LIKAITGVELAGVTAPLWSKAMTKKRLGVAPAGLGLLQPRTADAGAQPTRHCHLAGIVTGSPEKLAKRQKRYRIADKHAAIGTWRRGPAYMRVSNAIFASVRNGKREQVRQTQRHIAS
jgi:hypothetical protein